MQFQINEMLTKYFLDNIINNKYTKSTTRMYSWSLLCTSDKDLPNSSVLMGKVTFAQEG